MTREGAKPKQFRLRKPRWGKKWTLVLDTEQGFASARAAPTLGAAESFQQPPRPLAVWQR